MDGRINKVFFLLLLPFGSVIVKFCPCSFFENPKTLQFFEDRTFIYDPGAVIKLRFSLYY